MFIKIREIPEAGQTIQAPLGRALLKEALAGLDANLEGSRAEVDLFVTAVDDHVILRGRAGGAARIPCARCLREVTTPIEAPIKMVFTPADEQADGDDDLEADMEYATHDGSKIDLDDLVREALILAVPMSPLCSPTCKGLCAVCGGDKNERDCGCETRPPDPRLAVLKELKL